MAKDKPAEAESEAAATEAAATEAAATEAAATEAAATEAAATEAAATEKVEAFVLRDCGFGQAGEVVTLPAADAKTGAQHGMLDLHPDAVKAAKLATNS